MRKKNMLATIMQSFADHLPGDGALVRHRLFAGLHRRRRHATPISAASPRSSTPASRLSTLWLPGVANIPEFVFSMFQMTFAIITPALIAGAFAERMKFSALLLFMALWLIFVYCPIAHWVWGGGFLGAAGVLDFAGGTVVHINAGVAGLVCALDPRQARRLRHRTTWRRTTWCYSVIGASLLWVGWFGFNAGSELAADGLAGAAMMNTQVATAAAGACLDVRRMDRRQEAERARHHLRRRRRPGRDHAGLRLRQPDRRLHHRHRRRRLCYFAAVKVKHMFGYDDSLDAFGVHGVGGIVGALLTGVLRRPGDQRARRGRLDRQAALRHRLHHPVDGHRHCGDPLRRQGLVGLRPTAQEEVEGLDITQHGEVVQ